MEQHGHDISLSATECQELLLTRTVGRVGWAAAAGPTIQPVAYLLHDGVIMFRTAPTTLLGGLAAGAEVCFQIDDLDESTSTGWSVLVRGTSRRLDVGGDDELPTPWAPGKRHLVIVIEPHEYTGRAVSGDWPALGSERAESV
ncbi:MAG: pyridoxamine 5'-phosphate oxidase family protein [Propionicimonas sp.]